jgi:hypothetical protein
MIVRRVMTIANNFETPKNINGGVLIYCKPLYSDAP